jgi:hypothetical protein
MPRHVLPIFFRRYGFLLRAHAAHRHVYATPCATSRSARASDAMPLFCLRHTMPR